MRGVEGGWGMGEKEGALICLLELLSASKGVTPAWVARKGYLRIRGRSSSIDLRCIDIILLGVAGPKVTCDPPSAMQRTKRVSTKITKFLLDYQNYIP